MKRLLLPLLISTLLSSHASALYLTSEGEAPIRHNDISTAKYLAIVDAMNQASLKSGAQITSDTIMNNFAIRSDTVRIRTKGKVGNVHLLQEWREEGVYRVRISAETSDIAAECGSPDALVHARQIGITQFTNLAQHESGDLRGVERGLAQMMVREIGHHPSLRAIDISQYAISAPSLPERREQIRQLARQNGLQFILEGALTQATRESFNDLAESGILKSVSNLARILHQQMGQPRHLEIQTTLLDGETGERIATIREGTTLSEKSHAGREKTVGSHAFLLTESGKALQRLITLQGERLSQELSCQPMSAPILAIQGNTITLPAGENSGIHMGDRLIVVERNNPLSILGVLQITQVSATRATGVTDVDANTLGISEDDLVRSW